MKDERRDQTWRKSSRVGTLGGLSVGRNFLKYQNFRRCQKEEKESKRITFKVYTLFPSLSK